MHKDFKKNIYFIILAGGNGERLWPLSRQALPKQLLTINQHATLIEQAIERVAPLAYSRDNIWISTTKEHEAAIRAHVQNKVGTIIVEPASRNTGPAILYCSYKLQQHDPSAYAIFLPADAFIPTHDNALFATHIEQIIDAITVDDIIALSGIKPTHPATGYGYIEYDVHAMNSVGLHNIVTFHEKPTQAVAEFYLQHHSMLWNIGMFGARIGLFMETFKNSAPALYHAIDTYMQGNGEYEAAPNISIDYAVIEHATNRWVLPAQFSWCDVGNIDIFLTLQEQYGNKTTHVVELDAHNNLVQVANNFVALVGVNNICVVQVGNILLITPRDKTDMVKNIVHELKKTGQQEYL